MALAKKLVNDGSHMLDPCCAIVGEDEKRYRTSFLEKIATRVPAPILVDSTEADVVEEALKRIPRKAIVNSIKTWKMARSASPRSCPWPSASLRL